jgi:ribosomal protein S18 acetylase RimI-like enzyme
MEPGIAEFERMAARHWQGTEQERLGGWLLRAAGGFTGRANSALPTGDPGMPAERAVDQVEAWYDRRGLKPTVVIATSLAGDSPARNGAPADSDADGALDGLLAARGWPLRNAGATMVMTARSETVAGYRSEAGIRLDDEPGPEWLAAWRFRDGPPPRQVRPVLLSAPAQVFASVHRDGRVVGTGRLSVTGGWAGITAVAVDPAWRRGGLGLAVAAELAAQAVARDAGRIFLQVEGANAAARALYRKCGFTDRHRYHYRVAPVPA